MYLPGFGDQEEGKGCHTPSSLFLATTPLLLPVKVLIHYFSQGSIPAMV